MRLEVSIDGDWGALTKAQIKTGEIAVSRGMAAGGLTLKNLLRQQVILSHLGEKLANSIRLENYPKGQPSLGATALVYSKAPKLIRAFDEGPTITAKGGFWLAIGLPVIAHMRGEKGRKITPKEWEEKTGKRLTFIYRKGRSALLVDTGKVVKFAYFNKAGDHKRRRPGRIKKDPIPIFALVPRVRLYRRLHVELAAQGVLSSLPRLIANHWRST